MEENNKVGTKKDYLELWRRFQRRAYNLVKDANNGKRIPAIIWTNSMTEDGVEKYLLKSDYIIQLWAKSDVSKTKIPQNMRQYLNTCSL